MKTIIKINLIFYLVICFNLSLCAQCFDRFIAHNFMTGESHKTMKNAQIPKGIEHSFYLCEGKIKIYVKMGPEVVERIYSLYPLSESEVTVNCSKMKVSKYFCPELEGLFFEITIDQKKIYSIKQWNINSSTYNQYL